MLFLKKSSELTIPLLSVIRRKLNGIDFVNLTRRKFRNGACENELPTIIGQVAPSTEEPWLVKEWRATQSLTSTPVKVTIPGPMTIIGTTAGKRWPCLIMA